MSLEEMTTATPIIESETLSMKPAKKAKKAKKDKKEKKAKKEKKKRKERDIAEPEAEVEAKVEEKVTSKKMKGISERDENGNALLSNFPLSDHMITALTKRNIAALFPIQEKTFGAIYQGKDVIGKARTGMGKTLAFALPVLERLIAAKHDGNAPTKSRASSKCPQVICLAPTRELAKQVASEFDLMCPSHLKTVCIYGGVSYESQHAAFRKGVDVLVGTTGRIIDHIDRGTLTLDHCQYFILDEADTMLEMGFREDIDRIFKAFPPTSGHQTLLFSATLPDWIAQISQSYMKPDVETINLVKDSDSQASQDVQHLAISCHWQNKLQMVKDVLAVYRTSPDAKTIVFAETKKDCNEFACDLGQECQVLHGDIAQNQREITMEAFRQGKVCCLNLNQVYNSQYTYLNISS